MSMFSPLKITVNTETQVIGITQENSAPVIIPAGAELEVVGTLFETHDSIDVITNDGVYFSGIPRKHVSITVH